MDQWIGLGWQFTENRDGYRQSSGWTGPSQHCFSHSLVGFNVPSAHLELILDM